MRFRALDPETAEARFGRWLIEGILGQCIQLPEVEEIFFLEENGIEIIEIMLNFFFKIHLEP